MTSFTLTQVILDAKASSFTSRTVALAKMFPVAEVEVIAIGMNTFTIGGKKDYF